MTIKPPSFRLLKIQTDAFATLTSKILADKDFPLIPEYYARLIGATRATADLRKDNPPRKRVIAVRDWWKDFFFDALSKLPETSALRIELDGEIEKLNT